ncbi:type II secretion system protein [uncultured Desulfobacter sp.]|uniref:type II secretion system protein n=1 Tax=uncultured Desulfobacter sp. TaxID=240139 RepID=UPI0029F57F10|nr:type II secretion system protein [uncultured Desulfobacter sp.]
MKRHTKTSKHMASQKGFTLIEILIVVMVLGILAMIIVPQINVSTEDAKESTLSTNITALRNAIELYYHQHNGVYPGAVKVDGSASPTAAEAATAFVQQLTRYTEADGTVSVTKTADAKYGPYIKNGVLPTNPFNEMATVLCDVATTDITSKTSDATTGWKFYVITGNLMANDGDHDDL